MTTHRIGVIPGDGIGPTIVAEAMKVVRAAGVDMDEVRFDLGADRYARDQHVLDDDDLAGIRSCDAILKGPLGPPIGDTVVPPGTIERGIILRLRFALDQYVNLRPFNGNGVEFVVVRENTEGTYAGEGGFLRKDTPHEIATQGSVNTRMASSAACATRSSWRCRVRAITSRSCTRPTCSPSPVTCGSASSTSSRPSTPT